MKNHKDIIFCSIGLLLVVIATIVITSVFPNGQIPLFKEPDRDAIKQQELIIQTLAEKKNQAFAREDYQMAQDTLGQLLEMFPGNRVLEKDIARCQVAQGIFAPAEATALRLAKKHDLDTDLYAILASIYLQKRELGKAAKMLENIRKLDPSSAHLAFFSISFYVQKKQTKIATQTLNYTRQKFTADFEKYLRDPLLKKLMSEILTIPPVQKTETKSE